MPANAPFPKNVLVSFPGVVNVKSMFFYNSLTDCSEACGSSMAGNISINTHTNVLYVETAKTTYTMGIEGAALVLESELDATHKFHTKHGTLTSAVHLNKKTGECTVSVSETTIENHRTSMSFVADHKLLMQWFDRHTKNA